MTVAWRKSARRPILPGSRNPHSRVGATDERNGLQKLVELLGLDEIQSQGCVCPFAGGLPHRDFAPALDVGGTNGEMVLLTRRPIAAQLHCKGANERMRNTQIV